MTDPGPQSPGIGGISDYAEQRAGVAEADSLDVIHPPDREFTMRLLADFDRVNGVWRQHERAA